MLCLRSSMNVSRVTRRALSFESNWRGTSRHPSAEPHSPCDIKALCYWHVPSYVLLGAFLTCISMRFIEGVSTSRSVVVFVIVLNASSMMR